MSHGHGKGFALGIYVTTPQQISTVGLVKHRDGHR